MKSRLTDLWYRYFFDPRMRSLKPSFGMIRAFSAEDAKPLLRRKRSFHIVLGIPGYGKICEDETLLSPNPLRVRSNRRAQIRLGSEGRPKY